jgi:hypothetical protein
LDMRLVIYCNTTAKSLDEKHYKEKRTEENGVLQPNIYVRTQTKGRTSF